jgi:hypothetical protein
MCVSFAAHAREESFGVVFFQRFEVYVLPVDYLSFALRPQLESVRG